METQSCLVIPTEDGIDAFISTQWMDHAQMAIADVLGISSNRYPVLIKLFQYELYLFLHYF